MTTVGEGGGPDIIVSDTSVQINFLCIDRTDLIAGHSWHRRLKSWEVQATFAGMTRCSSFRRLAMRLLTTTVLLSLLSFPGSLSLAGGGDDHVHNHTGVAVLDARGMIDSRQGVMSYIGSNMRTLSRMAKGDLEFDRDYVRAVGGAVSMIAGAFPHLFQEGTGKELGGTEADDSIFSDLEGFTAQANELGAAARAVAASADASEFAANFPAMAGTCSSCHSQYRSR